MSGVEARFPFLFHGELHNLLVLSFPLLLLPLLLHHGEEVHGVRHAVRGSGRPHHYRAGAFLYLYNDLNWKWNCHYNALSPFECKYLVYLTWIGPIWNPPFELISYLRDEEVRRDWILLETRTVTTSTSKFIHFDLVSNVQYRHFQSIIHQYPPQEKSKNLINLS